MSMARLTTTQRGYGANHQALRKAWARKVAAGSIGCARCGLKILPGEPWDLGHVDGDRSRYTRPEHRAVEPGDGGPRDGAENFEGVVAARQDPWQLLCRSITKRQRPAVVQHARDSDADSRLVSDLEEFCSELQAHLANA